MAARAPIPAPQRLLAMAAWVPRVFLFAWTVEPRFRREPVAAYLKAITPARTSGGPPLTPDEMVRIIANVLRWKRGRLNHGCFVRSLTRYHFLRRLGVPVSFELGVEGTASESANGTAPGTDWERSSLRSHAWLSLEGRPYLETEVERIKTYRSLLSWPPS